MGFSQRDEDRIARTVRVVERSDLRGQVPQMRYKPPSGQGASGISSLPTARMSFVGGQGTQGLANNGSTNLSFTHADFDTGGFNPVVGAYPTDAYFTIPSSGTYAIGGQLGVLQNSSIGTLIIGVAITQNAVVIAEAHFPLIVQKNVAGQVATVATLTLNDKIRLAGITYSLNDNPPVLSTSDVPNVGGTFMWIEKLR